MIRCLSISSRSAPLLVNWDVKMYLWYHPNSSLIWMQLQGRWVPKPIRFQQLVHIVPSSQSHCIWSLLKHVIVIWKMKTVLLSCDYAWNECPIVSARDLVVVYQLSTVCLSLGYQVPPWSQLPILNLIEIEARIWSTSFSVRSSLVDIQLCIAAALYCEMFSRRRFYQEDIHNNLYWHFTEDLYHLHL